MQKLLSAKKITKATFKSFIERNRANLYIDCRSRFDGMTDCVETNRNHGFEPVASDQAASWPEHSLGIAGLWLVGGGRDYFELWNKDGFVGINLYNSCGSQTVAIKEG